MRQCGEGCNGGKRFPTASCANPCEGEDDLLLDSLPCERHLSLELAVHRHSLSPARGLGKETLTSHGQHWCHRRWRLNGRKEPGAGRGPALKTPSSTSVWKWTFNWRPLPKRRITVTVPVWPPRMPCERAVSA